MVHKIQFLSSFGKFHEYNFIKQIIPNEDITIYSDTGYADFASKEVEDYYKNKKIALIKANDYSHIKNKILRRILNLFSAIRIVIRSRKINYDYCIIHFLSTRRAILSLFLPSKRKIILVTYGSDILRRKNLKSFFFSLMMNKAYRVIETTGNIHYCLKNTFNDKYEKKTVYIPFPSASYDILDSIIATTSKNDARLFWNLPLDKFVIVCGHTSTRDEQFELLIPALLKCKKDLLQKIHFVFPMTYGNGDYISYRKTIKDMLERSSLTYTLIDSYVNYKDLAKLHIASDIHITSISTDALSFFMLEELYCGADVLYGSWLHYLELENNHVKAMPYDHFDDIPTLIHNLLTQKNDFKVNISDTRDYLKQIQSPFLIRKKWNQVLSLHKTD